MVLIVILLIIVNDINFNDNIASSTKAHISILVTNLLSFIMFFIPDSTSYFGNDGYMSLLLSKLTNCSSSLNFSSFMFSTNLFDSLIKIFPDSLIYRNSFDISSPILYIAEFCVLITNLIFNGLLCIFNNGPAEGVFGLWGFKSLCNFSLINPLSLRQIQTKQKDKMETSGVVYEVDCNNCLKKYTGETGRKLKERMKEHKDDVDKSR